MFGKTSQGDLNGFLDAGSHIQGELRFEDTFRVDGRVDGGVVSDGVLIVGERGEIQGEIRVRRIYVSGILRGRVKAEEYLEISPSGRVFADLEVASLRIEAGAVFEGSCSMNEQTEVETPSNVTRLPVAKA